MVGVIIELRVEGGRWGGYNGGMSYEFGNIESVWLVALLRVLRVAVLSYVGFCILFIVRQRRLLYLPRRLSEGELGAVIEERGLAKWPLGSGGSYRGLIRVDADSGDKSYKGTVLLFHGNAGCAVDREFYFDQFAERGWRLVLVEYPGYGARGGSPSEAVLREDGRESVRLAHELYGGRVVVMGESLGSAVAAAVAADPESLAEALILATPWDRLSSVVAALYPWLPVRPFIFDRWDSIRYLREYRHPVTVIVAMKDEVIPVACTDELVSQLPASGLSVVRIEEAMHNDWFWLLESSEWCSVLERCSE